MASSRLESLHAQLSTLLENAQYLLADSNLYSGGGGNSHMPFGSRGLSKSGSTAHHPLSRPVYSFLYMQAEIRTMEFWRSIIAECIASFVYVLIVMAVTTSSKEDTLQTNSALAAGLAMGMLSACFGQISGSHANPAITIGMILAKQISPLRSILYICAQCGGGIAGAALVLGVHGRINDPALISVGATFGMEFVLTFLLMYAFLASRHAVSSNPPSFSTQFLSSSYRANNSLRSLSSKTPNIRIDVYAVGIAYAACLICWKGSLNPARALGSAFVSKSSSRFQQHWIYWVGPIIGALSGAFTHEYIFHTRRKRRNPNDPDSLSVRSEDDILDDLERAKQYKANIMQDFQDPMAPGTGPTVGQSATYSRSYSNKRSTGHMEPLYSGTKSLYNQPTTSSGMYDRYNDGTKSMYSGYDGGPGSNLRRSRSIHAKFPPGNTTGSAMSRRNPYDYLPDEPGATKPDIMQSSMITNINGTSRIMGAGSGSKSANPSPRYADNYATDKLGDTYGDYGSSRLKDDYDSGGVYGKRTYSSSTAPTGAGNALDRSGQDLGRGDFQRMSRMRNEFYSPQYNSATYSQQNGCSIPANAGLNTSSVAPSSGVAAGGGYHSTTGGATTANY